jgi:hypothetical protein
VTKISTWKMRWKRDRDPGGRAGLSREIIVEDATKLFAAKGPDEFSRLVARRFYVFPPAIRSFVKGGLNDLRRAIAGAVLPTTGAPSKEERHALRWRP